MGLHSSKSSLTGIGNYDVLEKIAEGGMGTIYKGRHRQTGQIVALKVVPASMAKNTILLKRFEQEFRAASMLDHPNIVRALEYDGSGSSPFLVMEFVDGESLGQRVERDGRLPETEAIHIMTQVAQALYSAHKQKLIHRDIKPDNIMVTRDGIVKVADLGLVKEVDTDLNLTRTGRGLGTPHFMAPEQFRNAKSADARCDIYSMGATLYMLVTGELPFKSCGPLDAWMKKIHNEITPARQLIPSLSERVDWAIRRSMSADPEQRPATCKEFVEDLTGQSGRKLHSDEPVGMVQDVWYLVYRDDEGQTHTVKGSTEGIRRSYKQGLLGDAGNIRACRSKTGTFETLRSIPEFRDLVVTVAPAGAVPRGSPGGPMAPGSRPNVNDPNRPPRVATPVPHIDLGTQGQPGVEWLKWLLLIGIGVATAVAAHFFFTH
jgi:serine/threonine protein kinase